MRTRTCYTYADIEGKHEVHTSRSEFVGDRNKSRAPNNDKSQPSRNMQAAVCLTSQLSILLQNEVCLGFVMSPLDES
jgi:hypothetical protein